MSPEFKRLTPQNGVPGPLEQMAAAPPVDVIRASDLALLMKAVSAAAGIYNRLELEEDWNMTDEFIELGDALRDLGLPEVPAGE